MTTASRITTSPPELGLRQARQLVEDFADTDLATMTTADLTVIMAELTLIHITARQLRDRARYLYDEMKAAR